MWRRMTVAIARGWWIIATSIGSCTWWWWVMPCIRVVRIIGGTTPIGVAVVIPLSALIRIVGLPGCWDTRIGIPLITPICRSVGIWLAARIRHLGGQACENLKLCCTSGLAVFQAVYESFFKIESAWPFHTLFTDRSCLIRLGSGRFLADATTGCHQVNGLLEALGRNSIQANH